MAREFDVSKKLSADDISYLRARYHESYVDRMVELHGGMTKGAEKASQKADEAVTAPSAPEGDSVPETAEEDLIGATEDFDPGTHTVDEVQTHLKDASDEERERVLALERDGKGRSGILNA